MVSRTIVLYFRLIAVITALIGGVLVIHPETAHIFFNSIDQGTLFFTRIIGSTLLGYAALNAITSIYPKDEVVFIVAAWSNFVTLLIASVLCTIYMGELDSNAWLIILQHYTFTLGFLICIIKLSSPLKKLK